MVRVLRHKCDHQNCQSSLMDDEELYGMINNGNPPISTDHFKNIQLNVLLLFKAELLSMQEKFPGKKQIKVNPSPTPTQSKQLEDGKEFEGIIVDTGNPYNSFKVKCNFAPFPLNIASQREGLYEGDEVLFTAICKPNIKDPTKMFWMADDVHLKD